MLLVSTVVRYDKWRHTNMKLGECVSHSNHLHSLMLFVATISFSFVVLQQQSLPCFFMFNTQPYCV